MTLIEQIFADLHFYTISDYLLNLRILRSIKK